MKVRIPTLVEIADAVMKEYLYEGEDVKVTKWDRKTESYTHALAVAEKVQDLMKVRED